MRRRSAELSVAECRRVPQSFLSKVHLGRWRSATLDGPGSHIIDTVVTAERLGGPCPDSGGMMTEEDATLYFNGIEGTQSTRQVCPCQTGD